MSDQKKLAPGGVLNPEDDINFRLNPKFDTPDSTHVPAPGPRDTPDPAPYQPPSGPQDTPDPPYHQPAEGPGDTPDPAYHQPAPGPKDTPDPPYHVPSPGPEDTPNPPGHIPAEGPPDTPDPPGHVPADGPEDGDNPPGYVPPDGPENTPNPPGHVPEPPDLPPSVPTELAPDGLLSRENDVQLQAHLLDDRIRNLVAEIDPGGLLGKIEGRHSPTGGGGPGTRALDPTLYIKSLINIGNALGKEGIALFTLENSILWSMNPNGSVFNPLYFINRAPIINSLVNVGIAPEHRDVVDIMDGVLVRAIENSGEYERQFGALNESTPLLPQSEVPSLSVDEIVDDILDGNAKTYLQNSTLQVSNVSSAGAEDTVNTGPVKRKVFRPLDVLFTKTPDRLGFKPTPQNTVTSRNFRDPSTTNLGRSSFSRGIMPMDFPGEDDTNAIITRDPQRPQDIIDDDVAYVPVSFTDLRPLSGDGSFRTIYFRPIITSLTENLSPEWDKKGAFGRTDPVGTYASTTRTVSLGLELHAFAPEDLDVIYKKLNWLSSLVYPEYDKELLMKSGPVCRMRVGDVIKSNGLGVPGFIESLDFDYSDSIWEIKKDHKVPRSVRVSLTFQVLHDTVIGRHSNGNFGGIGYVNGDKEYSTNAQSLTLVETPEGFRSFGITGKTDGKK